MKKNRIFIKVKNKEYDQNLGFKIFLVKVN